jgi:hypothetical protein
MSGIPALACGSCGKPFLPRSIEDINCLRCVETPSRPSHGSPIPRKAKPNPSQTYFGRSQASIDMDNLDGAYLVGSEPAMSGPFAAPSWPADPGVEPPLGIDVNAVEDMLFTPHGGSALVPPQEETEG